MAEAVQITVSAWQGRRRRMVHCDFSEIPEGMTWRRVLRQLLVKAQMKFQEPDRRVGAQRGD